MTYIILSILAYIAYRLATSPKLRAAQLSRRDATLFIIGLSLTYILGEEADDLNSA